MNDYSRNRCVCEKPLNAKWTFTSGTQAITLPWLTKDLIGVKLPQKIDHTDSFWRFRFFLVLLFFRVVCVWLVILIALYHLILARLNWFFLNRRQHPNTDWQNTGRTAWLGALPHLPTHVFSLGFTAMKDAVLRSVVVFNQIIIEIFCRLISWPIFNRGDKKK